MDVNCVCVCMCYFGRYGNVWNDGIYEKNARTKTNSSPLKMGLPQKEIVAFQPFIFRGEL